MQRLFYKIKSKGNYQTAVWKRISQNDPEIPNSVGRGWRMEPDDLHNELAIDWMVVEPAPQALPDLLA